MSWHNKTASPPRTRFTCTAPAAKAVFVAGTFNDWNPTATPLKRGPKGVWSADIELAPGRYEFKFLVDGVWCCEPSCDEPHDGCAKCVPNAFGTMNRVIEVGGS